MRKATVRETRIAKAMLFGPHAKSTAQMSDADKKRYFDGPAGDVAIDYARAAIKEMKRCKA